MRRAAILAILACLVAALGGLSAAPLHRRRRCHRHRRAEGQGPAGAGERPPDAIDLTCTGRCIAIRALADDRQRAQQAEFLSATECNSPY